MTRPAAIAIDFGTSNTVVAGWNVATQQAETLVIPGVSHQIAQNPPLIPSLAYIENALENQIVVGQAVRDRGLDLSGDRRFFRNFKRGIGNQVLGLMPELDGQFMTFERVGEWFLRRIGQHLADLNYLQPDVPLVLTVPVDSFEAYRYWLGRVCEAFTTKEIRLLDEPTAAALGYGMAAQDLLLVIDFGGGTLDLSLVRLDVAKSARTPLGFLLKWGDRSLAVDSTQQPKTARVLAKAGQNLGGSDIDNWLVDHFHNIQNVPVSPLVTRLAERLKIQLSMQPQATEVYFDDRTLESHELTLDRQQFAAILQDHEFFECLDVSMQDVLRRAQQQAIQPADIGAVLLVGGTAQLPAVQRWVQGYFDATKIATAKPFEAIAQGALQVVQGIEIADYLHHSYGIRYWDRRLNRHNWHPLIKTGQPYPMEKPVELVLGASTEGQPSIELIIGELGAETGGTEVYFDGDRLITRSLGAHQTQVTPLNDSAAARTIANLDPPGVPGSDRVRVRFRVDAQRFLRMTVEDLLTNRTLVDDRAVVQLS